jgi:L-fuculose-phosphate aldolase
MRGIFSTRSPDRPTPIGLHPVRIVGREGLRLQVHPLEVIDGTPVIDIKPDNSSAAPAPNSPPWSIPTRAIHPAGRARRLAARAFRRIQRQREHAPGRTRGHHGHGQRQGTSHPADLAVIDLATGAPLSSARASSELAVHLEIYRNQPRALAIVHTHPPRLLALSLRGDAPLLDLPLFEGRAFASRLTRVAPLQPGTPELGQAVGQACRNFEAVFMDNHGLVCWGESMTLALGLAEELESLAGIAMMR